MLGSLFADAVNRFDRVININHAPLREAGQQAGISGDQSGCRGCGDGFELADMAERERPQERAQSRRSPHSGEHFPHRAVTQDAHVVNAVRARDHAQHKRGHLQIAVRDTIDFHTLASEIAKADPVHQLRRRHQPRRPDQILIIEARRNRRCGRRCSHLSDGLSIWLMLSVARHIFPGQRPSDLSPRTHATKINGGLRLNYCELVGMLAGFRR